MKKLYKTTTILVLVLVLSLIWSCNDSNEKQNRDFPEANLFLIFNKKSEVLKDLYINNTIRKENIIFYTKSETGKEILSIDYSISNQFKTDSIVEIKFVQKDIEKFANKGLTNLYLKNKRNSNSNIISIDINNNNDKNALFFMKTILLNGNKLSLYDNFNGDNTFVYYIE